MSQYRKYGKTYCSKECSDKYKRQISSETMAKTNRKYASERMKKNNPTKSLAVRAKISKALKTIKHKPIVQGGNGRGMTEPQRLLYNKLLHIGAKAEFTVKTNQKRINKYRYPTHYNIDIAIPIYMIAIEVDGASHSLHRNKEKDIKKTNFLTKNKWTVIRFKNKQIIENIDICVENVKNEIKRLSRKSDTAL